MAVLQQNNDENIQDSVILAKTESKYEQMLERAEMLESTDSKKAILIYQQLIHNKKQRIEAYINLGALFVDLEYYPQALQILQQALGIRRDSDVLFNLGIIHFRRFQFAEAVNYFMESLSGKDCLAANIYAGLALYRIDDYDKALFFFDRVIAKSSPKDDDALKQALLYKLEIVYRRKQYKESIEVATSLLQIDPKQYKCYRYLGFSQLFLGNFKVAEALLAKALEINPNFQSQKSALVPSKVAAEWNFPKDREKLKALEQDFIKKKDHRSLGFLYFYRGEHRKAEVSFEKARNEKAKTNLG